MGAFDHLEWTYDGVFEQLFGLGSGEFEFAGVSIKFEVGSWLEKSNRLYEQGAVRPLNLGGSGGMLPQKI